MELEIISERMAQLRGMFDEMMEAGRMRSDFALRHFVVGAHDTPGRQRSQALAELQAMYFSLADVWDDMRLAQIDLGEMGEPENERGRIEYERTARKILALQINLMQRIKEVDCLLELLQGMKRYTAQELEAEEPLYWAARLARQAFMAQRDAGGNIDAMLQMATIPGELKPAVPLSAVDFLKGIGFSAEQIAKGLADAGIEVKYLKSKT